MTVEKNLIETVLIDGKKMAIERQRNNVWVNLTEMAKPFGKQPIHWSRTKEAQAYLQAMVEVIREQTANSQFGMESLIISRQGGASGESGTWCTDYRIAMRFAQWLSPKFSIMVDDLLVRLANGERIVSEAGFFNLGGKQWISCASYCTVFKKSVHSFYGLLGNYPREFTFWDGGWYMSRDLFNMKEVQIRFESCRIEMRVKNDRRQLSIEFPETTGTEGKED